MIAVAHDFVLPDTDGRDRRLSELAAGGPVVIVFTCAGSAEAVAWHRRLVDVGRDYAPRDVHLVFVNPCDSLDAMREQAAAAGGKELHLRDGSQEVARAFGVEVTPEVFVIDGEMRVRYRGAPDEDHEDPAANALWLREALDDVLSGVELRRPRTDPAGCAITWRP
ncbi:MAG TPA: redoxin domain-containing protein [Gaiellales bacterium]|nr:redoxin domain-containing protein [Gaiellales bacterium]